MNDSSGIKKETIPFIPSFDWSKSKLLKIKYTIPNGTCQPNCLFFKKALHESSYTSCMNTTSLEKIGYTRAYCKIESGLE